MLFKNGGNGLLKGLEFRFRALVCQWIGRPKPEQRVTSSFKLELVQSGHMGCRAERAKAHQKIQDTISHPIHNQKSTGFIIRCAGGIQRCGRGYYKIGTAATWNKALFRLAQQVAHFMAWIGKTASTTAWPDGEEAHHTAPSEPSDWGRKEWRKSPWRWGEQPQGPIGSPRHSVHD